MNDEEKKSIFNLIEEFSDVFYLPRDALNDNPEYEYKIEVREGTKPMNLKPFRVPFHLKDEMKRNIDELLEKKVIEESTSPWGLNAFLVPKKVGIDGKKNFRLVVDLRKLNELMIKDQGFYHFPFSDNDSDNELSEWCFLKMIMIMIFRKFLIMIMIMILDQ